MYNSSRELDWDTEVAPVVSEYCGRMMAAGYTEQYRKNILKHALAIYDDKINKNDAGDVPLNRPKGYKKLERRKMKKNKKKNWSSKNGYVAPIIVPSTPGSILAKRLRAKAEAQSEIKFNIVEKGGITIEKMLSKPNPTSSIGCGQETCEGCKQQEGGMKKCQKSNHMYSYTCMEPGCKYKYIGEITFLLQGVPKKIGILSSFDFLGLGGVFLGVKNNSKNFGNKKNIGLFSKILSKWTLFYSKSSDLFNLYDFVHFKMSKYN